MSKVLILKTSGDDKAWLVNFDSGTVVEIDNDGIADDFAVIIDSENTMQVNSRSQIISHAQFMTQ